MEKKRKKLNNKLRTDTFGVESTWRVQINRAERIEMKKRVRNEKRESSIYIPSENVREESRKGRR